MAEIVSFVATTIQLVDYFVTKSLQDPGSPQYRAYKWATQSDQVPQQAEPSTETRRLFRMIQRFALATLLYSIAGLGSWVKSTVSECEWGDVGGSNLACSTGAYVVAVNTSFVGTGGTIPPEIGLLTDLISLELPFNDLTSSIPTELGLLSALTYLDLSYNDLTSSIPTELGSLTALTYLDVELTSLTGMIPTELGQLQNLEYLLLSNTFVTGSIPSLCDVAGIQIEVECGVVDCTCCWC